MVLAHNTEAGVCKDISIACTGKIGKHLMSVEVLHLDPFSWARTFISSHIGVGCQWFMAAPFSRDLFSTEKDLSHLEMAGRLPLDVAKANVWTKVCHAHSRAPHGIRLMLDVTKATSLLSFLPSPIFSPWLLDRFLLKSLLKKSLVQESPSWALPLENLI